MKSVVETGTKTVAWKAVSMAELLVGQWVVSWVLKRVDCWVVRMVELKADVTAE